MKLLGALAQEHAVFRRLLARIEACYLLPPAQARKAVRSLLAQTIPALEAHEDLEHALIGEPPPDSSLLRFMESQRRDLESLREEIALHLEDEPVSIIQLERLTALLAARLNAHFLTEEVSLWPRLSKRGSRSLGAALAKRTSLKIESFLEDLEWRKDRLERLLD